MRSTLVDALVVGVCSVAVLGFAWYEFGADVALMYAAYGVATWAAVVTWLRWFV
jgi:hypothetical protein